MGRGGKRAAAAQAARAREIEVSTAETRWTAVVVRTTRERGASAVRRVRVTGIGIERAGIDGEIGFEAAVVTAAAIGSGGKVPAVGHQEKRKIGPALGRGEGT